MLRFGALCGTDLKERSGGSLGVRATSLHLASNCQARAARRLQLRGFGTSGTIRLRDSDLTTLENTLVYMVAQTEIGL